MGMIGLSPSKKRVVKILQDVSGIIRPSRWVHVSGILVWCSIFVFELTSCDSSIDLLLFRMTLLLGPPASGKTTFLKALSGEPDDNLRVCPFSLPLILWVWYLSSPCVRLLTKWRKTEIKLESFCSFENEKLTWPRPKYRIKWIMTIFSAY